MNKTDFPRTHDLQVLIGLLPPSISLGLNTKEVLSLNRYIIEARYPGDWEPIERAEAEEAVTVARKVRSAVRAHLPEEARET